MCFAYANIKDWHTFTFRWQISLLHSSSIIAHKSRVHTCWKIHISKNTDMTFTLPVKTRAYPSDFNLNLLCCLCGSVMYCYGRDRIHHTGFCLIRHYSYSFWGIPSLLACAMSYIFIINHSLWMITDYNGIRSYYLLIKNMY